jgi:hypothetical protein
MSCDYIGSFKAVWTEVVFFSNSLCIGDFAVVVNMRMDEDITSASITRISKRSIQNKLTRRNLSNQDLDVHATSCYTK